MKANIEWGPDLKMTALKMALATATLTFPEEVGAVRKFASKTCSTPLLLLVAGLIAVDVQLLGVDGNGGLDRADGNTP